MERRQFVLCGGVLVALPLLGCGDDGGGSSGSSSGGTSSGSSGENNATGGAQNNTGGTQNNTGGSQNMAGSSTGGSDNSGDDGGDDDDGGGDDNLCMDDIEGRSSTDFAHDHAFTLQLSDILAGEELDLDLEPGGTGNHTHVVKLTAEDLAKLRAGETVEKDSQPDGTSHSHKVTLSCVA